MDWKRRWVSVTWLVLLSVALGSTENNIGCIFNEEVCIEEQEWCYDDGAFGRCLSVSDNDADDLYRFNLNYDELDVLEKELESLMVSGYRWSHTYTQCLLQTLLFAFKTGVEVDTSTCGEVQEEEYVNALNKVAANMEEDMDPKNTAYIRYTPSAVNPHADYADEVYYPPSRFSSAEFLEATPEIKEHFYVDRRSPPQDSRHFSPFYNTPDNFRSGLESKDQPPFFGESDYEPLIRTFNPLPQIFGAFSSVQQNGFQRDYNTPDNFRNGYESRDLLPPDDLAGSDEMLSNQLYGFDPGWSGAEETSGEEVAPGYTEGGVIFPPDNPPEVGEDGGLTQLLGSMGLGWGFKRRERLDVKKPGPPFNTNNYAFQNDQAKGGSEGIDKNANTVAQPHTESAHYRSTLVDKPSKKIVDKSFEEAQESDQYDIVDTTYAYIKFKDSVRTWNEGTHIVNTVANLLHVPKSVFTNVRVDRNEVTFKVDDLRPNGLNASEVAKRIENIKDELRREINVVVTSTGIGDKTKLPSVVIMDSMGDHDVFIVFVIVCGVLGAVGISAVAFHFTKRDNKLQKKLTSMDTEPSKHYQDLCRARMSSKVPPTPPDNTTPSSAAPTQRIASLSRESDNSPSSRSSTSSWTEEPAMTNIDIATGHTVLAYMEEHLKNRDRLDSEWAALCAYEAEPCDSHIAERPENVQKNRYPYALPYDHARVVLNELSNITGSDYINASTITDHDPRNPAYIVCQGPLPHTTPDLWQMVWEQGCVVVVMLTRLVEGENTMCHRYWPEEGSEVYHIYEVHLVSEHIWCDDYLVRSFYLKNLKTGETRTVTQFHFLSWPDGGVPTSTKALLEFRRKVNKSFRGRSCPIVVHCSDGVGRSGAYILLDMVLNRIAKGAKEIDIAATLEHIRDQRAGSVATKQQFQTVLTAVAEEVQAILKALPQQ